LPHYIRDRALLALDAENWVEDQRIEAASKKR
jgi:hypothetical protein